MWEVDYRITMKLLIVGDGESGKDTVAAMFAEKGMTFKSSSRAALEIFLYDLLKQELGYDDIEEAYKDRRNFRTLWKLCISVYNLGDPARLCREILANNDIYVGMRSKVELEVSRKLFDAVIWVKRDVPKDPTCEITEEMCDFTIDNRGSLVETRKQVLDYVRKSMAVQGRV